MFTFIKNGLKIFGKFINYTKKHGLTNLILFREILCLKDDLKDRNRVWDTAFTVLEKDEKISFQEVLKAIPPEEIISIIQKNLKTTREGVLACIKTYGKRISWPLGEIMPPKKIEKPKMATNAHVLMPRKIIVINKLLYKTVARRSSTLVGGHVKIHRIVKILLLVSKKFSEY